MNPRTRKVFISYSHRDEKWKNQLVAQLKAAAPNGEIDVWHDGRLEAGDAWRKEIEQAIAGADTAILLISADFLNSAFIRDEEVGRILKLRASGNLRVIPVIVRPCPWEVVEWLGELQARPLGGRALSTAPEPEAEADLAALARELFPSKGGSPGFVERQPWAPLAVSLLPAMAVGIFVAGSATIRVTTPLQLDIVARAVSFTVSGADSVQLLNNSTAFSRLVIEQCDTVSFPPLTIVRDDLEPDPSPSAVTFRCNPRVPGSKVVVRTHGASPGDQTPRGLGTLGRIMAEPGDRVTLAMTSVDPAEIWLDVSRSASFDFAIEKDVPFEIISEFAETEDVAPGGPVDIGGFRARLAESSTVRLATVHARRALSVGIEPAHAADLEELFRADVDIPVESLSLFERGDADDRLVSTAISGTLRYPDRPDLDGIPISIGEDVRLGDRTLFRLTQLRVDPEKSGLWFRFQGDAANVSIGSEDRRLSLLDRLFDTRMKLVGLGIAIAVQWAWLRRRRLLSLQ